MRAMRRPRKSYPEKLNISLFERDWTSKQRSDVANEDDRRLINCSISGKIDIENLGRSGLSMLGNEMKTG